MKLLFDENLSRSLVNRLQDLFPGSDHVVLMGLEHAGDSDIFRHARDNDFVIVTKDSDFNELLSVDSSIPCLIWIRTGNCSTDLIEHLIRKHHEQIVQVASSEATRLLILF